MPLLAREGEAPRLRVRDDGAAKASRWSRVAMMASGAVALGVVATHARAGVFSGPAEASLGLPVKVEEIAPYADQYKGPVFIHIPKNGGTSIELLAAYNGVRYVARARVDTSAPTASSEKSRSAALRAHHGDPPRALARVFGLARDPDGRRAKERPRSRALRAPI